MILGEGATIRKPVANVCFTLLVSVGACYAISTHEMFLYFSDFGLGFCLRQLDAVLVIIVLSTRINFTSCFRSWSYWRTSEDALGSSYRWLFAHFWRGQARFLRGASLAHGTAGIIRWIWFPRTFSMLISDSRFDLVWFRLSCDHGWIRSGSVNVRKQQQ